MVHAEQYNPQASGRWGAGGAARANVNVWFKEHDEKPENKLVFRKLIEFIMTSEVTFVDYCRTDTSLFLLTYP